MLKNKLVKFISVLASASMLVSSAVTVAHAAKVTLAEKLFDSGNKAYVHPTTGENWYYLATPYVFNDGNIQVYSRHIDSENASFTEGSHESMKYRLHLDKPLTYNGKTSNAAAIGYNGTYNTVADAESGSTNAPYIQYSVPTDAVDLSTPETNTNLTMETLVRCDNDAGAYFRFQQNYIDKNDSTKTGNNGQNDLLRFTKDNKITVNGTEVGTWTKGTVYKAAVEFKVGTPYANVYIDDVLVAENANALWGHTFTGLTYIRYYANFSDVQTTNAEELVWFDDIKFYKSTTTGKIYESLMHGSESTYDWRYYDVENSGTTSRWYTFSMNNRRYFHDGKNSISSNYINPEKTPDYTSMKYRAYFEKPLTYRGVTSNAIAIGYNSLCDSSNTNVSGNSDKPYIRYDFRANTSNSLEALTGITAPTAGTNLIVETIVKCDNEGGFNMGINTNYTQATTDESTGETTQTAKNSYSTSFLSFDSEKNIVINNSTAANWTKGTAYKVTIVFKAGTPYADVYLDGKLIAKDTAAIWDLNNTFTGINVIDLRADYSTAQTTNADELVWFDDFKVYSGVYLVVTSLNSQATVTEESNLVYLETSMTVEEALEKLAYNGDLVCMDKNYTVKSGSDVVVTGDIITASDRNFTRAYDVLTAEPETNSIGDVTYTCNDTACDYNTFEAGTIKASVDVNIVDEPETVAIIIAEYDENGLVQMKFNEETVTSSKTVDVSADVTDETHNVKIMVWNSMTGMLPVKNVLSLRNDRVNVFIASDSIAADYTDEWYPQGGWGMFLGDYMTDEVYVANEADPGETAKSFYNNFWSDIKDNLKAGDYVIVSFMHNDIYALSKTGESYQSVEEYREYLAKYYEEATAAGANVIYLTGFNRGEITDTHIQTVDDVEYNYVTEMKNVVDSLDGAICLDLHQKIMDYLTTADAEGKLEEVKGEIYLYNLIENGWLENTVQLTTHKNSTLRNYGKDLTHLNLNGADKAAGWIADLINSSESPLAEYIK